MTSAPARPSMGLAARAAVLQTVIDSTIVTDATGRRLDTESSLECVVQLLRDARGRSASVYLVGNGGSAAVASHAVTDFLNVGRMRAMSVHDASLLTCMANDFGYEHAFARVLSTIAQTGDVLFAISSSGRSPNICNAAACVRDRGGTVITLSGFDADNALRGCGHYNVWLDSRDYGMVEIGHQLVLHNLSDRLAADA